MESFWAKWVQWWKILVEEINAVFLSPWHIAAL